MIDCARDYSGEKKIIDETREIPRTQGICKWQAALLPFVGLPSLNLLLST